MENVIELERDGKSIALEEALRDLGVPNQFIGVHRVVGISAAALHGQISGKCRAPRSSDTHHAAISVLPSVEVVFGLQFAACTVIVERTAELDL